MPNSSSDTLSTRLRWNPEACQFMAEMPAHRRDGLFIKGPLPLDWFDVATALPGKTLHVALAIWFQVGLERSPTVKLSQKRLARFSVSRDAKYDALKRLADAGLIEVKQSAGQSPTITVIQANHKPS